MRTIFATRVSSGDSEAVGIAEVAGTDGWTIVGCAAVPLEFTELWMSLSSSALSRAADGDAINSAAAAARNIRRIISTSRRGSV